MLLYYGFFNPRMTRGSETACSKKSIPDAFDKAIIDLLNSDHDRYLNPDTLVKITSN